MRFAVEKTNSTRRGMRFQWIDIPDSAVHSVKLMDDEQWLEVKTSLGTFYAITYKM